MQSSGSLRDGVLGTNYVPSPEESSFIRNSLIPIQMEMSREIDAEVDRVQATLVALRRKQRAQNELLEAHKALLTPMRRLIPDVLLEIFRHCHDHYLEAPMRLGRVCRMWRELVLSTPTLWTVVMLHDTMHTRRIVPFARACAEYSKACPIRVVLKFMHRRSDTQVVRRALFEALEILARHVHRWQTFEVFLDKAYRPDDGEFKLPSVAPLVEKLVLVIDPPTSFQFSHLPSLRELRLPMIQPQGMPLLLHTNMRNLSIGGTSNELTLMDCWTILFNSPEIENFDIASIKLEFTVLPEKEITLLRLHDLRIGPYIPDPAPLIHRIKAPALQRLRLIVGKSIDFDSTSILRLVEKCRPPLTTLSLVNMNGADLALCIPLLPSLTNLMLQHTSALDLVISRLTEQDNEGRFYCPALEHFGLRLCLFTGGRLVHFARERRKTAGGLRVLVDKKRNRPGDFLGLMIELSLVGEFTDEELKELYDLQT